jgi:hypothetical protein
MTITFISTDDEESYTQRMVAAGAIGYACIAFGCALTALAIYAVFAVT